MTLRIAAVLLVGVVGLGCSSKADPGPTGPTGPTGPKGDTGAGTPGISVLSAALSPGSTDCPTGGSQFTSASGTTFACNGAQGPQGGVGPKGDTGLTGPVGPGGLFVLDASGNALGQLVALTGPAYDPVYYWLHNGKVLPSKAGTGAWYRDPAIWLFWQNSFCTSNLGEGPFFGTQGFTDMVPMQPQFVFFDGTTGWTPDGPPSVKTERSFRQGDIVSFGCSLTGSVLNLKLVTAVEYVLPAQPVGPLTLR